MKSVNSGREIYQSFKYELQIYFKHYDSFVHMDAVGVGSLNVDLIYRVKSWRVGDIEFEPGGEIFGDIEMFSSLTSSLEKEGELLGKHGGGSAANTMVAMKKLGFETGILGVIGSDGYGDFLLGELDGVDHSRVRRCGATGICLSIVKDGERSLIVLPNANNAFTFDDGDVHYINNSRIVHLTSFKDRNALENQIRLVNQLAQSVIISFDPGEIYARMGIDTIGPLLSRADIIFPSEREIEILTGKDPLPGGKELIKYGPRFVVCTMGAEGSLIITPQGDYRIEALEVEVVDKTGAGDVYAAGFLAGMLKGWPPRKCGEFATLASAISISRCGRDGYPDKTLLDRYERGEIRCSD